MIQVQVVTGSYSRRGLPYFVSMEHKNVAKSEEKSRNYVCVCIHLNTGCPRRKGPNFGRVFLRSNYTDITQNTYIQSSMVTEILNIEK